MLIPAYDSYPVANVAVTPWTPQHIHDEPQPPPPDTREAALAALAAQEKLGHDGKRQRVRPRRTVDPYGGIERWLFQQGSRVSSKDRLEIRKHADFLINLLPPVAYSNASTSLCTRYVHTSTNKVRCPVNVARWTPDGRRILTGSSSGEFTLWNGLTFNFETILQAHDSAIRAMEWSNAGAWLISADNAGVIKYFQPNMNNLQVIDTSIKPGSGGDPSLATATTPIRDVTWAPNDERFATAADDGAITLWNFERMRPERVLTGHGWDVKCVKWHPSKGLLVSGSKDNLVKFWDPRSGSVVTTLHSHKNTVQACEWSPNGNLVATGSRDQFVRVFDIRAMKELAALRGHDSDVCSLAWHPVHHDVLVSGGSDGALFHWQLPDEKPAEKLLFAHDSSIWSLAFHPLGHILVSASNDHTTRFWSRGRPALAVQNDRFHVGRDKAKELGEVDEDDQDDDFVPGLSNQALNNMMMGNRGSGPRGGGNFIPGFRPQQQQASRGGYNNNGGGYNNNNNGGGYNNNNNGGGYNNNNGGGYNNGPGGHFNHRGGFRGRGRGGGRGGYSNNNGFNNPNYSNHNSNGYGDRR